MLWNLTLRWDFPLSCLLSFSCMEYVRAVNTDSQVSQTLGKKGPSWRIGTLHRPSPEGGCVIDTQREGGELEIRKTIHHALISSIKSLHLWETDIWQAVLYNLCHCMSVFVFFGLIFFFSDEIQGQPIIN